MLDALKLDIAITIKKSFNEFVLCKVKQQRITKS